jgi:hypothetical protein
MRCNGVRTSWPWKGYHCGASATYEVDGKTYCSNHAVLAAKESGKKITRIKIKK